MIDANGIVFNNHTTEISNLQKDMMICGYSWKDNHNVIYKENIQIYPNDEGNFSFKACVSTFGFEPKSYAFVTGNIDFEKGTITISSNPGDNGNDVVELYWTGSISHPEV